MGRKIRLRRKKAGETLEQWTARIERRNKRHDWKLIRDDEDEGGWNFRLSIKGISQRNKRLRRKGVRAGLKFDEDTEITDEESSSGDSDQSESELETDLDVDICSDSADESEGLYITDADLHDEIRQWRIKQRKLRSER